MKIQIVGRKTIFSCFVSQELLRSAASVNVISENIDGASASQELLRRRSVLLSYSKVGDKLEGYKIKSALPFKIFSTL